MTVEFMYLVGSVLFWLGLVLATRALMMGAARYFGVSGRHDSVKGLLISGVAGALMILVSSLMRLDLGREVTGPHLPLVWLYMPFPGWMALGGVCFGVYAAVQAYTQVQASERKRLALWSVGWFVAAVLGFVLLKAINGRAWIFRGYLPVDFKVVAAFVILGVITVALMVMTARNARYKGLSTKFAATLALLVGCVIFGAPLVWELITSVKEQRDQTTANGFIWLPQVQDTHPFIDPKSPLYEGTFDGQPVKAKLEAKLDEGRALFEIERPYSTRGRRFESTFAAVKEIPRDALVFSYTLDNQKVKAFVTEEKEDGSKTLEVLEPPSMKGREFNAPTEKLDPVRHPGLRVENYTEALEWLPPETHFGLVYLNNTLLLVILNVAGTILSCAMVGYGFARLRFPGRDFLFTLMLSTMMLPAAVTMMPQFLIFRWLGWIDTLYPLWVPSLFAGAFNVFLLKQFFGTIPIELEEAARIDGCGFFRTFWQVMLPQVQPALAAIGVWTFMGTWNNFMGPLIYISSPEKMPIVYALAMFNSDRGTDMGLLMAFSTMAMLPVLLLFFFAQRFFIEGVQLSGLGGR